eukprot:TRINITY_DN64149_c0_g1_i1.p1 TRINITY_DN64149_c0_g1~~TRINITY_DN64149_c0_g1_i1.p1  ORF type:complete len:356 (-),score=39.45 TRINITY_DN64149_c0_g1_i1:93-1160(-)
MASSSSSNAKTAKTTLGHDRSKLPWVEKHRPSSLDDILAHEEIISTIRNLMDKNRMPHLLFYGPPGTGKTTTILACARHIYGDNFQKFVLELNASDERGIDIVRNRIKDFASTRQIFSAISFKLIVLDEADQMTHEAQAALRRVMEKFTRNVRFCLICNNVNKLIAAIQSRCTRFRFSPLKKIQVLQRLQDICKEEEVPYNDKGLEAVHKLSGGDMRKCLNILQSTYNSFDKVEPEEVYQCTGNPSPQDMQKIVQAVVEHDFSDALREVKKIQEDKGLSINDMLGEMLTYVMKMDFNEDIKIFLLEKLADAEYNLAFVTNEKINLSNVVAAWQVARISTADNKPISSLVPPTTVP